MTRVVSAAASTAWYLGVLALLRALFIGYFWLNGSKDIVYTLYFHLVEQPRPFNVPRRADRSRSPLVVLLYCTCDDFSGESLLQSMRQRYDNFETVILDDTKKPAAKAEIDRFGAEHGARRARRA